MKRKYKSIISIMLAFVFLFAGLTTNITNANAFSKWVWCRTDFGKAVYNGYNTDVIAHTIRSKSAMVQTPNDNVKDNIYNKMMEAGGFNFGEEGKTPFNRFGFAGLSFSSYAGEWKYVDVDACANNRESDGGFSNDYGMFYEGRYEPQSTHAEIRTSNDIRTEQFASGVMKTWKNVMRDTIAGTCLSVVKFIVATTITIIGLSLGDVASFVGLGENVVNKMFTNLYTGVFQPFIVMMFVITGCYIMYYGLAKRQVRTAISEFAKSFAVLFLAIFLASNPKWLMIPNNVATVGQSLIIAALGQEDVPANDLCAFNDSSPVGTTKSSTNKDEAQSLLQTVAETTRTSIGCRMWAEFVFRPFVKAQWNEDYENLVDLGNDEQNKEWTGTPTVDLGNGVKIDNWALFQVSTQTDKHVSADGSKRPRITGVHPDWWRIVDATSNINYKIIYENISAEGGTTSSSNAPPGGYMNWVKNYKITSTESPSLRDPDKLREVFEYYSGTQGTKSNLLGHEEFIIKMADKYGINVMTFLAQAALETTMGTKTCGTSPYNFGCIMYADWQSKAFDGRVKKVWDIDRHWAAPDTAEIGIEMQFKLLKDYYVDQGYVNYPDYLQRYSPAEDNNNHENFASMYYILAKERGFDDFDPDETATKVPDPSITAGSSSASYGIGNGKLVEIEMPVKPTKYWSYWTGNDSSRVGNTMLAALLAIVGSIAPLVFSILSAMYGVILNLTMSLAPVFLIFGLWPVKGRSIFQSWLATIFSLVKKKIITSFLLMISILVSTKFMSLLTTFGYMKATVLIGLMTAILLKNKETLIERLGQVNMPNAAMDLQGAAKESTGRVSRTGMSAAKTVGGLATVGTLATAKTLRNRGISKESLKEAFENSKKASSKYIEDKFYSSGNPELRYAMNRGNSNQYPEDMFCHICGKSMEVDDLKYKNEEGNVICDFCYNQYNLEDDYTVDNDFCDKCGGNLYAYGQAKTDQAGNHFCGKCYMLEENDIGLTDKDKQSITPDNFDDIIKKQEDKGFVDEDFKNRWDEYKKKQER